MADAAGAPGTAAGASASSPSSVGSTPSPSPSIAVLPFADLSPEKDQDYFCEGIAEESSYRPQRGGMMKAPTPHGKV